MLPLPRQTKTDCKMVLKDGQIDAMIHLIEIQYNEITFWNAVLQVTTEDYLRFGDPDPPQFPVEVHLSDGRKGRLHISHGRSISTDALTREGYHELAGTGHPS
jgi:hypothetical protein